MMDYKQLLKHIREKTYSPLYILHGEEPYFIDELTNAFEELALEEHEKDFNQAIVYGKDTELLSLVSQLKSFPMMGEKRLIILKEAQDFKELDELEAYADNPNPSTIFVIAHKYKAIDARKKFFKAANSKGIVFKSDKIKDYQLPDWISSFLKSKGYLFSSKVPFLLAESIGNDLSRIANELNKLSIVLSPGSQITEVEIETNIGISKEYNVFELNNAVASKDVLKAMKIVKYFDQNPKAGELLQVIPILFKFFSQIMRIHFIPNASRDSVAQKLQVHPFVAGELMQAKNLYNPKKIAENIECLHLYDLKAKGLGNATLTHGELMREMVFQLLN